MKSQFLIGSFLFIFTTLHSQVITTKVMGSIKTDIQSTNIVVLQHFVDYAIGDSPSNSFTKDFAPIDKKDLIKLFEDQQIVFSELTPKIDSSFFRKSSKIEFVRTTYRYQVENMRLDQIAFLKGLDSATNNIRIGVPNILVTKNKEIERALTLSTLELARKEAEKIADHLDKSIAGLSEIELLSEYPEEIPIGIDQLEASNKYNLYLELKVSYLTEDRH